LEIELAPGSYEFTVELYTESFRIGDRIGPGFWKIIDVQPDEELEITFYPATETLNITGWIELLLPAPTELHAEPLGSEVHLSWLALPQQNQGYFILAQTDPLNRFQVLNTRPVAEPNFTHNLGEEKFPMEIRYTVAAVSENGLVGYYAATKTVFLESD
ncbi:MAG: hypothetical protein GX335_07280, partial [Firmicutes bacterium]|nr:hypothetical protein [Bacillota bacterium]